MKKILTQEEFEAAQKGEAEYWGDQEMENPTIQQELRFQETYIEYMFHPENSNWLNGKNILDIGGGPISILLKRVNRSGLSMVIDPIELKDVSWLRYAKHGIFFKKTTAEIFLPLIVDKHFDEIWIYNVLAHVMDPELILKEAKRVGKCLRIFEVLNTGTDYMHPWSFTREFFDGILGEGGKTVVLDEEGGVRGEAYYGVFKF